MLEVVMLFEDGTDCAIASVDDMLEATEEAMKMFECGHCAILRKAGHAVNRWMGTSWNRPVLAG